MITLVEAKNFMGISPADTSKDTVIQMYIDMVTASIEAYCNNIFLQRTVTDSPLDTFHFDNLDGSYEFILGGYPVSNVVFKRLGTTLTNVTNYEVSLNSGVIYVPSILESSFSNYTVTYTAGYLVADVPKALKGVALQAVKAIYDSNRASSVSGTTTPKAKSKDLGDFSVTYETSSGSNDDSTMVINEILEGHAYILNRYSRIGI